MLQGLMHRNVNRMALAIVYKRSADAGLTWSKRLSTPESWATSREVPTILSVRLKRSELDQMAEE